MEEMEVRDSTNPNDMIYDIEKKVTGAYKLKKVLYWAAWILGSIISFCLLIYFAGAFILLSIPIISVLVFFAKLFYKYLCLGYRYEIKMGVMKLYVLYGKNSGKRLMTSALKDMEIIAPYNRTEGDMAKYHEMANDASIKNRIEAVSYMEHPDVYFAIFNDEEKGRSVMFFEATSKFLKIAKFYNSEKSVITQVSR